MSKNLSKAAWWLVIVGGFNWGLIGLGNLIGGGNWNLIQALLGSWRGAADLLYVLVGAAAFVLLWDKISK